MSSFTNLSTVVRTRKQESERAFFYIEGLKCSFFPVYKHFQQVSNTINGEKKIHFTTRILRILLHIFDGYMAVPFAVCWINIYYRLHFNVCISEKKRVRLRLCVITHENTE